MGNCDFEFEASAEESKELKDKDGNLTVAAKWKITGGEDHEQKNGDN